MLDRYAETTLKKWIKKTKRKPLVLRGARQVGKSTLVRQFAEKNDFILNEINLERHLYLNDIFKTLERSSSINRVTVYRILDLLVDHGVVDRLSTGGRAAYYGLAPNEYHKPHPHFYCKSCEDYILCSDFEYYPDYSKK